MPPSAAAYMAHHVEKHARFVPRRDWISFGFGMTSFPRSSIERLPIFQGFRLRNHSLKSTPALTFNKFMVFVFSFSYSSSSVNYGSPSAIRGKKEEVETWLDATSFVAREKKNVFHPIMVYGKQ